MRILNQYSKLYQINCQSLPYNIFWILIRINEKLIYEHINDTIHNLSNVLNIYGNEFKQRFDLKNAMLIRKSK